ncbi:hypothetical protein [Sphingobium sp. D43FB]|nr:hypothetical protein [Sphingobium sp. D43FB]
MWPSLLMIALPTLAAYEARPCALGSLDDTGSRALPVPVERYRYAL